MATWRRGVLLLLTAAACAQQLPFRVDMTPPRLSNHQRLISTISVRIDGKELSKRRGPGRLEVEVEIVDRHGERFRSDSSVELKDTGAGRADVFYTQDFFVIPGSYTAYVSVGDTASGEGGAARRQFVVPAMRGDPLPRAWRDLPAVEFLPIIEAPDKWYHPSLNGRLRLPLDTPGPVKVDVLVNISPSEVEGVAGIHDLNMRTLIPALKAISQIDLYAGTINIDLLDLTRRSVIFTQTAVRDLNWSVMREALLAADPNVVDVKSLAQREQRVQYFLEEVGKRVEAALGPEEPPRVLIVLSGPMSFKDKVELQPITTAGNPNCKVYYIRYGWGLVQPEVLVAVRPPEVARPAGTRRGLPPATLPVIRMPRPNPQEDYLEATLRPLKPRLFDVQSPLGFRRALATLLAEISKLEAAE
jgi:hypothetical protein